MWAREDVGRGRRDREFWRCKAGISNKWGRGTEKAALELSSQTALGPGPPPNNSPNGARVSLLAVPRPFNSIKCHPSFNCIYAIVPPVSPPS